MRRRILCGLILLPALLAAQPKLRNAKLENRTGALDAQVKAILSSQVDAAWVGYRLTEILPVPLLAKQKLLELTDSLARLSILQQFLEQRGLTGG